MNQSLEIIRYAAMASILTAALMIVVVIFLMRAVERLHEIRDELRKLNGKA